MAKEEEMRILFLHTWGNFQLFSLRLGKKIQEKKDLHGMGFPVENSMQDCIKFSSGPQLKAELEKAKTDFPVCILFGTELGLLGTKKIKGKESMILKTLKETLPECEILVFREKPDESPSFNVERIEDEIIPFLWDVLEKREEMEVAV